MGRPACAERSKEEFAAMTIAWRNIGYGAALVLLAVGCNTAPPGAGFTNGEPVMPGGPEKAAVRSDMPPSDLGTDPVAEAAASSTGTGSGAGVTAEPPKSTEKGARDNAKASGNAEGGSESKKAP
jgi:hypothetical protein